MVVSLWCKIVPIYWRFYGPRNFLWFSDVALLTTAVALWLESPLLASMMTLAIALPETGWNVDFFVRIATGRQLLGPSAYMFDSRTPRWLRALSLFTWCCRSCCSACSCASGTTGARGSSRHSSRGSGYPSRSP
jgi:hypothetical protein